MVLTTYGEIYRSKEWTLKQFLDSERTWEYMVTAPNLYWVPWAPDESLEIRERLGEPIWTRKYFEYRKHRERGEQTLFEKFKAITGQYFYPHSLRRMLKSAIKV